MHIISKRKVVDFIEKHPNSKASLESWYKIISKNEYKSMNELKNHFPSVDNVDGLYVFNISGNNFRLIAAIHFNRNKLYIRGILTHSEYDKNKWKKENKK